MSYSVSEVSRLLGISVRTLHYYDEINLLNPSSVSDSGYRYYDDDAIALLQQILFYRELDISLDEIRKIMSSPDYDRQQALKKHRELLLLKRCHLDGLLELVNETLEGKKMSKQKITASDIEASKKKYADEVRERWGKTDEYSQSEKNSSERSSEREADIANEAETIFDEFAANVGNDASSAAVQELVAKWQEHITRHYYKCTNEILSCLGEMYIADERFKENLDSHGAGTAELMCSAIKIYCNK